MNTSTVKSRFLSHPEDLGIVTVGFSGGQVCLSMFYLQHMRLYAINLTLPWTPNTIADAYCNSPKPVWMQALLPSSSLDS